MREHYSHSGELRTNRESEFAPLHLDLIQSPASSAKFWEAPSDGTSLTIGFGEIGASVQTTIKDFDSESATSMEANILIAAQIKKGYSEVSE